MNAMDCSPIYSVHNRTGSDSESGNSPCFCSVEARQKLQQNGGSPPCPLRTPPEKRSSGVEYPTYESFKEKVDKKMRKFKEEENQAQQQNQEKLQRAATSKVREDDGEARY